MWTLSVTAGISPSPFENVRPSSPASTAITSPAFQVPMSICSDSGSSMSVWMARRSGRAP